MPTATLGDWANVARLRGKGAHARACVAFSKDELIAFLGQATTAQVALIKTSWTGKSPPTDVAFAAKVELPASAKVSIFGDIHGEFSALLQEMQLIQGTNKHIDENLRMVGDNAIIFCGDLLDRGPHSIEVFAFALLLRMANPGRVFVARGNHECGAAAATSQPSRAFCSARPLAHSPLLAAASLSQRRFLFGSDEILEKVRASRRKQRLWS
jgi:hypothetical protein